MTIFTYLSDIATHLQTAGYGTFGDTIKVADPATGNGITITPYGGGNRYEILSGEQDPHRPDFQILVRNASNKTALTNATSIYLLLFNLSDTDIGLTHFIYLRGKAPPLFVRKTETNYFEYSVNFSAVIQ